VLPWLVTKSTHFKNTTFINWIDKYTGFIVVGFFLAPVLVGIEALIRKKAKAYSNNLPAEGLNLLLKALDYPVDKKMNRFLSELNSANNRLTYGQVFQRITQPEKQVAEIIRAIHMYFG